MSKNWTCIKCGCTYHFAKPSEKPTDDYKCDCTKNGQKSNWRADMHIPH